MSENNTIIITRMNINKMSYSQSRSRKRDYYRNEKRYCRNNFRKLVCLICCECKNMINFDGCCLCECHEDSFNKNI